MSQYNPYLSQAAVEARLRARLAEASQRRLASGSPDRRGARDSRRGFARAVHGLLQQPGVISGRGPIR
ncbi:MAG TPA: hypothetical protein VLA91_13155 [Acidimicrobiia bacterium]|nr:hypothetical protein [Acidimicrobiia bacterium]